MSASETEKLNKVSGLYRANILIRDVALELYQMSPLEGTGEGTGDLCVLFLTNAREPTITLTEMSMKKTMK